MMLAHILVLSAYLFFIGTYGLITRQNIVRALMCLELILNAVNINFVTFSYFFDNHQLKGDILAIFVISIAAAEAAIGLAIVSIVYCNQKSICINQSNLLNNSIKDMNSNSQKRIRISMFATLRYDSSYKNLRNQSISDLSHKSLQKEVD